MGSTYNFNKNFKKIHNNSLPDLRVLEVECTAHVYIFKYIMVIYLQTIQK